MKRWEICSNCEGNGSHSRHLGVITGSDRDDWSDEEFNDYMNGSYDTPCSVCAGAGKVVKGKNRIEKYYATDEEYFRNREGGY